MRDMIKTDMILYNGTVYTMSRAPEVTAVAVSGNRILALGSDRDILGLSGPKTRLINLKKLTVLPGFTDCHTHFYSYGLSLIRIDFRKFNTFRAALDEIRRRSKKLEKGEWLLGRGWDKNYWGLDDFPDRYQLDAVCGNPCAFTSHDGHGVWANSAALKVAGVDSKTESPRGGVVKKDADGQPTGIFLENAIRIMNSVIPRADSAGRMKALLTAQKEALRKGVTGVHDFEEDPGKYGLYQDAALSGKLKVKMITSIRKDDFPRIADFPFMSGFGGPNLRIGPLKLYCDGALGTQTAYMYEPYAGSRNRGLLTLTGKELKKYIEDAESSGISCAVHAIGDRANNMVVESFLARRGRYRPTLPRRIEHVQILRPQDIARLKSSRAVASVQPSHLLADRDTAERYWGKRCRYAYPFRSLLTNKIPYCFGSDAPIEIIDPIIGIHAAVNRCGPDDDRGPWYPEEKISVKQAAAGFTTGAAHAGGYGIGSGMIRPGDFADMVVLSDDIFRMRKRDIYRVEVAGTICSGVLEFGSI